MKKSKTSLLFGIPIQAITMTEALDIIHRTIQNHGKLQIGVVNAAKVVNMRRNQKLGEDVLSSDLILADGASVVLASRILGKPLPERVTGIDLMMGMLERGNIHGYRVYCFGATETVSLKVADKIKNDYPNVILAGRRNGYFSDADEESIAQNIADSQADILLVAITSPKKENFLARWSEKMGVAICHGVGGSFDVLAGEVERAPESWQKMGLEWLYRLKQEPGRLWKRYLVTNSLFCWLVLKEFFANMLQRKVL